jgi:hypothetical protein
MSWKPTNKFGRVEWFGAAKLGETTMFTQIVGAMFDVYCLLIIACVVQEIGK